MKLVMRLSFYTTRYHLCYSVTYSTAYLLLLFLSYPDCGAAGVALSISDSVQIIWSHCPVEFRQAVQESQCFMYRGESPGLTFPMILNPPPDLLLPTITNDPQANFYFDWMHHELQSISPRVLEEAGVRIGACPTNGHIATSNPVDASHWGEPASIWPLGESFSYVWPRNRPFLYPGGNMDSMDDLVIDQDLAIALRTKREVLFSTCPRGLESSQSTYLAIPRNLEPILQEQLNSIHFGLRR